MRSSMCGHNGGMDMSAGVMAIILSAAGGLVTLGGGFFAGLAWLFRRMDEQFDKVEARFDTVEERFDMVDDRFARVYDRFAKVDGQLRSVQSELNDVKVAVARPEGPQNKLNIPRYLSTPLNPRRAEHTAATAVS